MAFRLLLLNAYSAILTVLVCQQSFTASCTPPTCHRNIYPTEESCNMKGTYKATTNDYPKYANTWRLSVGVYRNNRYGFTFPCFWCRSFLQELGELQGF